MGTDNILILGDMNAYRNEDPITAIRNAGFTELIERNPLPNLQFCFFRSARHPGLRFCF